MSKQSQRERRQKEEESKQKRRLEFLDTLNSYLKIFAEVLPRNKELGALTEAGTAGYEIALQHLSAYELKVACDEGLKTWNFFPSPGEIVAALEELRAREPMAGSAGQWNESLENPNSKWNRALRWEAWKRTLTPERHENVVMAAIQENWKRRE
jgi:hypothetical protein